MSSTAAASLERLLVLDRLEVGPVALEPDRATATYTAVAGDRAESTRLAYRWEQPVFGDAPADRNLAAMVTAQVALNYGLFCREIVLHGPFDVEDRRFLEAMARNTAREILVKKFLEPNPFLLPEVQRLDPGKRRDFLQARLVFPDPAPEPGPAWDTDPERYAVLSSGGKESLLSHGLLHELGREVHSIFVNESGRHWLTARNAWRHFAEKVPHTHRVWTSADRVFSWMLRQLPFVRPDFQSRRADDYPIRLWTVAVFLFGALPILRRERVGHIVVGDEYDTTRRPTRRGIRHYDGLYDQSRYFDRALTRYYGHKGWRVGQCSLLRPLSELLVQKTLAERYPDAQRLQVSCHAAHVEDGRSLPCGRCEKCRRVVGMLTAVGADPTRCGYTPEQVRRSLEALGGAELHQEAEGARHLMKLLEERGAIPPPKPGEPRRAREPEVEQLRFDPLRSPADDVPRDLRRPLYGLLLEHAHGAVRRSGRVWLPTDPLAEAGPPSSSERPRGRAAGAPPPPRSPLLGELTWPQARQRLSEVDLALLPVGAIEQHGPHLPLDVDAYDAERLCRDVADACSEPKPLVLPLVPYGVSYHHEDFPGTLSVGPDTLARFVYEIGRSAAKQGISKLVIVNGHGGNGPALHFAAQMINRDARIFTCVDTGETSDADVDAMAETPNDVHAGEIETSTTLALRPHLVDMERAEPFVPSFDSRYLDFSSRRSVDWYGRTVDISSNGVLGDPTVASAEKGRRMWDVIVKRLVELVEEIKPLSLAEIHQRRY